MATRFLRYYALAPTYLRNAWNTLHSRQIEADWNGAGPHLMCSGLDFRRVFANLTGYPPFPWQEKLYTTWFSQGKHPAVCDIPTGLGKTSVVACWLIAMAEHPQKLPRRLIYVVNRRTVVDQTSNEVARLRARVRDAGLHDALSRLCAIPLKGDDPALAISTLRGQFADNRDWLSDPTRPSVIVGTVDMIGSRLLFNGYRAGSWQLARHAGVLGHDALLVHDEAHLEPSFQKLITWIERRQRSDGSLRPLRCMAMSATNRGASVLGTLAISDEDRQHPIVRQRYSEACKALFLHEPEANAKDQLVKLAWRHANDRVRVVVYVRQPELAAKVQDALLGKLRGQADATERVALLTGTIRGYERELLLAHPAVFGLLHSADEFGKHTPPATTTWLIATSAGEVGADFDADHAVCDLSSMDSMIQRFGRVNRRGGLERNSRLDVVLDRPAARLDRAGKPKPLSQLDQARCATASLLEQLPLVKVAMGDEVAEATCRDASAEAVGSLANLHPSEYMAANSPEPPWSTPHDVVLDAWAMTSIQDEWTLCHDVHPYLHGRDPQAPETVVAWRAELDELALDAERRPEEVAGVMRDLLRHYPLRPLELLREKPLRVAQLLVGLRERTPHAGIVVLHQRSLSVLRLRSLDDDPKLLASRLNYQTILVPAALGGLSAAGVLEVPQASSRQEVVPDVADSMPSGDSAVQPPLRRRALLRRDDDDQWRILTLPRRGLVSDSPTEELEKTTYTKWTEARDALAAVLGMTCESQYTLEEDAVGPRCRLLLFRERQAAAGAVQASRITLGEHNAVVARIADAIQQRLQLPPPFDRALSVAALNHDLGKGDARWQGAIGNGELTAPLAKSFGRDFNWRVLDGYRHEFGSLRRVVDDLPIDEARDLVLHLIASHHGRSRPHFDERAMADNNASTDNLHALLQPAEIAARFCRLQRRFGHWGLAWLESLVMAADAAGTRLAVDGLADEAEEDER